MARQKSEDNLVYLTFRLLPTWAVVAVVAAIYSVLRFLGPALWHGSPSAQISAAFALPITALLALFAAVAEIDKHKRRTLLATQSSLETLKEMTWQDFELLVGEAYRRQGYAVEEKGGSGPDGGVDLILRRNGQTTLVQCKRWKQAKVGAPTVRELRGAVARDDAAGGIFVTCGQFTREAIIEAQGKPLLTLVNGSALLALVKQGQEVAHSAPQKPLSEKLLSAQTPAFAAVPASPGCPKCGEPMLRRTAKSGTNAGSNFWGCPAFPRCRGTRPCE